ASQTGVATYGAGTTGSRIANGTYGPHRLLEQELAAHFGAAAAIVFTTGYQANLAVVAGLAGAKDQVFIDADCHASIYDACKLSGAEIVRFAHNDPASLDRRLSRTDPADSNKLVIVEGLYSMFGDVAPLKAFVEVKRKHNAYLVVDEAHSFGVFGDNGLGVAEADGVLEGCDILVGTFSKSLAGIGGFAVSNLPQF
ncbi:MAG: aminotransferase class I/II-fold pyridoxal phosphate-dependent enzyme, partial [Alphaproteobacteria bacterium]